MLASQREGTERAVEGTSAKFGLKVSVPKTKHLVAGREAKDDDKSPVAIEDGEIGVDEFPYPGQ